MAINLDIIGKRSEPIIYEYTWKDCILYALGIGAGGDELDFVCELGEMKVFPTFAVVPVFPAMMSVTSDLGANPMMIVHGEQKITLHKAIPTEGKFSTIATVEAIYDKGKGALAIVKTETRDAAGRHLFDNSFSIFCRGEGGFGGDRGPSAPKMDPPEGVAPDFSLTYATQASQALLYRLSGDLNPLHANPQFAQIAGFDRPILHGLCTYGFAGRAILHSLCGGDPEKLKTFSARFSDVVFPGDRITTQGWKQAPGKYLIQCKTQDGKVVLNQAIAEVA